MTSKFWIWSIATALACAGMAACAAGTIDSADSITGQCVPGTTLQCVCSTGAPGTQSCNLDGLSYSVCACGVGGGGTAAGAGAGASGGGAGNPSVGIPGTAGATAMPMGGASAMAGSVAPGTGGRGSAGSMANAGMGGMAGAGMGGSGGVPASGDEVPANEACMAAAMWDPAWTAFEQEVLDLVNQNRAMGWNCDAEGQFEAAPPLTMNPFLRCSARLHSKDMADRDFFAHDNPDGDGPSERMDAVGYMGGTWGENIAMGQRTPEQVVEGWMESDGHCANIMRPSFTEIGVGFVQGASQRDLYWTQNFGAACSGRRCM